MRTETKYYAFDENEFDSAEECMSYEQEVQDMLKGVIFLDSDKVPMHEPSLGDIETDAMYMLIVDAEKARELFNWIHSYICFPAPKCAFKDGDKLEWDAEGEYWVNVDEALDRAIKSSQELTEILSKMMSN